MAIKSDEYGSIFGADSKRHIRQWESKDGDIKEFRGNIGVVVNPENITKFKSDYDKILKKLFKSYKIQREKIVYKSHEIGKLFPRNEEKIRNFHIGFSREILNLDYVSINYFFTTINSKYLEDGKVSLFGRYGGPTRTKDVKSFINMLDGYYNILCGWKLCDITKLRNCTFVFDGMETIYPTIAWEELTASNNVRIVYSGDHTDPLLSTADILTKHLDLFLRDDYRPLNEETIKSIITYQDKVNPDKIYYNYIGNPDIPKIKPLEERFFTLSELNKYIRRPIIFVSKGSLPKQRETLENLPIYDKLFDAAYAHHASIRIYNPGKDSQIIGKNPEINDLFLPLTKEADEQYELLVRGLCNIKKLEIK